MHELNPIESTVNTEAQAGAYILIVDDNADMRDYIRHVLKLDYRVHTVNNGAEALAVIRQNLPDLLITDLEMPEMDGLTMVKALRANTHTQVLPIIMLSATQDKRARKDAINAGVNAYFRKPFDTPELLRVIKNNLLLVQVRKQTQQLLLSRHIPQQSQTLPEAEAALQRYIQLIESLPAAFYYCDAKGHIELYNKSAVSLWGREPVKGITLWCNSIKSFKLNGDAYTEEECPMSITFKEGKIVPGEEFIIERPDKTRSNVIPYPEAIFDTTGNIIGGINMLVDITGLK